MTGRDCGRSGVQAFRRSGSRRHQPGHLNARTPERLIPLALALSLLFTAPAAAMNAGALFRRGESAERTSHYTGVKLIWACCTGRSGSHPDYQRSARIWHDGPGRTRLEFLPSDGGPARIVVENGSQRWFYSPRHQRWRPVSWRAPEPRLNLLLHNYRLLPGPVETVAGRRALLVRIEPRFPGNPHKQAWLDLATGITLRADLYDSTGRLVSRSEFLQFRPQRSLPASLFTVPDPPAARVPGRRTADARPDRRTRDRMQPARPDPAAWRPGTRAAGGSGVSEGRLSFDPALPRYLPRGYVLDRITRTRSGGTEVARALFTDGLNTLSLVEWRGPREPEDGGRERFWGPGDRLQWNVGPISTMLAGDLAAAELKRIANSVRPPRTNSGSLITRK